MIVLGEETAAGEQCVVRGKRSEEETKRREKEGRTFIFLTSNLISETC